MSGNPFRSCDSPLVIIWQRLGYTRSRSYNFVSLRVYNGPVVLGDGVQKVVRDFDRFVVSSGNHVGASDMEGGLRETSGEHTIKIGNISTCSYFHLISGGETTFSFCLKRRKHIDSRQASRTHPTLQLQSDRINMGTQDLKKENL